MSPRPPSGEIAEANKVGVHRTEEGADLAVSFRRHPGKVRRYGGVIGDMFKTEIGWDSPLTWLDVGAGYGELIEAAHGVLAPGSVVEGIEPMQAKVAVAQSRGLPVTSRSLSEVTGRYDVVSLINVFSHIPDFDEFGALVASKVKPGGTLFIETGNGGDLDSRADYPDLLYLPDHLVFAGVAHMNQMVRRIGLTVEAVRQDRVDDPIWALKQTAKAALRGRLHARLPYTSPFRTVFYKCRKPL